MSARFHTRLRRTCFVLALISQATATFADETAVRVVDGDTLVVEGQSFRLEGIDAPELHQNCLNERGKEYRCGQTAKSFLEALIQNSDVYCNSNETDAYGRQIATCFSGANNLNKLMVEHGHAYAFRRYSRRYVGVEASAKLDRRGLWAGHSEPPWEFRQKKWQVSTQTAPEGCPIKGNISRRGRIYHTPWSPHYARTRVNTAAGERWFCSEIEALAAGWRPPS